MTSELPTDDAYCPIVLLLFRIHWGVHNISFLPVAFLVKKWYTIYEITSSYCIVTWFHSELSVLQYRGVFFYLYPIKLYYFQAMIFAFALYLWLQIWIFRRLRNRLPVTFPHIQYNPRLLFCENWQCTVGMSFVVPRLYGCTCMHFLFSWFSIDKISFCGIIIIEWTVTIWGGGRSCLNLWFEETPHRFMV